MLTGEPEKASASLKPLMDKAMSTVPKELQVCLCVCMCALRATVP